MAANLSTFISDLKPSTTEAHLKGVFPEAVAVTLARGPNYESLGSAQLDFADIDGLTLALARNGRPMANGRNIVLSLRHEDEIKTLSVLVRGLPPHAREFHVFNHFGAVTQSAPFVVLPVAEDNQCKGYSFVYLRSVADWTECLSLSGTELLGRELSVIPCMFLGGRSRAGGA